MPVKSCFFILFIIISLLFLCMHACNAQLATSNFSKKLPSDKIVEKLKFSMDFNPKGKRVLVRKTITSKRKESENTHCKRVNNGSNEEIPGTENCDRSSLYKPKHNGASRKRSRRGGPNVRENIMHPSIFNYEDILETDYQPPQRKSPIHN